MNAVDQVSEAERTVYEIPEGNYPRFQADIAKLSRKSEKLIGLPIRPILISKEPKKIGKHVVTVCRVSLMAETPVIDGWTFLATLDHTNETGNIVRTVPNVSVKIDEKYRTIEPYCDHCQVLRRRKDTYLLWKRETGEVQQVGSTCLKDFLGGHDPYAVARMAEWLGQANDVALANEEFDEGASGGGMRDPRWISVDDLVTYSAMSIRKFGWVSTSRARDSEYEATRLVSTRDNAFYCMRHNQGAEFRPTEEDRDLAEKALEWARGLAERDDLDNYEHNLQVVANALYCEYRSTGLVASILSAYQKHLDRNQPQADVWVGEIGQKITGRARVVTVFDASNRFGAATGVIFRSVKTGASLKWVTGTAHGLVSGDIIDLKAVVKEHSFYKDVKQTVVKNCTWEKANG